MDFFSRYTMTIGGKARTTARTIDVINPATGQPFAATSAASARDLDDAVTAAQATWPTWRAQPLTARRAMLLQAANVIKAHAEALGHLFVREQGRPFAAARSEILFAASWLKAVAHQDLPVEIVEDTAARRVEVHCEPLGVVCAIVPWNAPVLHAIWKIAPALLAGNTMVLKPSPYTPLCALKLGELWRDILPPGVLNVISGDEALGPLMTAHPGFAKISFTGSTTTGRRVMAAAANDLKRLTLELGGNDVAIVMPDVVPDEVVEALFHGAFYNSAQGCVATKRMYIHDSIYDAVRDRLHALALKATMGDGARPGVDFGPVQNAPLYRRLRSVLEEAARHGLTLLTGRAVPECGGYFVPLTLVDNPPESSRVAMQTVFGPILSLLRFSDVDDAILRANRSPYGLAGAVWSNDIEQATAIARRLDTGSVWINQNLQNAPHIPFAGRKQSGFGVENGEEGLKSFTQMKTLYIPRVVPRFPG